MSPSAAILLSTLFWGTLWIPLRRLDAAGIGAAWATTAGFVLPLLMLAPFALRRRRAFADGGWPLLRAGILIAACIALYAEALLRGQVARVILLFYLTPVWSILLAHVLLGERVTVTRVATVVLGLSGMFVIFGVDGGLPVPRATAEWMGLLSGLLWAASMVALRRLRPQTSVFDQTFAPFLFLGLLFLACTFVPGGRAWAAPGDAEIAPAVGWLVLVGGVWMPVVLWLTVFGGSRLDPGRVAILLMFEIVVGLISAALLTDEPFTAREAIGAVLIISASGTELVAPRHRRLT